MKKNLVSQYLIINSIAVLSVIIFAFIQYNIFQKASFKVTDYIIPSIVGLIFGTLLTRNRILLRKLSEERELVFQKNRKIHSYVGIIVHDLKSPVAAIQGLMELLCEGCKNLTPDQIQYLTLMKNSSTSMLENISLILDNTRLESGIKPSQLETGNPYFTIQSTIDKFIVEALNKCISIQRLIDRNLPAVAYDKNLLDRILSNLMSNAIKYSQPYTEVKIYTEVFTDSLRLTVKDEGLGMSEEDLNNVFQEFRKLSARPTGNEGSTGLGLAITKKLAEQMNGEIAAHSEGKNKGSTFQLTLKIVKNNSASLIP